MYLESSLAISGDSVIKNCRGNTASVLFAIGKNSIVMDATSVHDTIGKSVFHLSMVEDVALKNVNFAKTSHKTLTM